MIPAIELLNEIKHNVFVYFPPNQHSTYLSVMNSGYVTQMQRYEARFKHAILPDVIQLKHKNFALNIPAEWKVLQKPNLA
jgi:hypothetical protein